MLDTTQRIVSEMIFGQTTTKPLQEILADLVIWSKYAKWREDLQRRETWNEICERNMQMHCEKYPHLQDEIVKVYNDFVIPFKVLPSMRSLQFAGDAIEENHARVYNCAYMPVDDVQAFSESMFLLLGGTGVGYSVQKHHVAKLPKVLGNKVNREIKYTVRDSITGWADAVKFLISAFFEGSPRPRFDFSHIRPKGSRLKTAGGKAPGYLPLKTALDRIEQVLLKAVGRQLTPLETHDIMCHIADSVLSGGIRRAAMIALFSPDDNEMVTCKTGDWYNDPLKCQRARSNNSAVLLRNQTSYEQFSKLWEVIATSGYGEPAIYWTNDLEIGTNPCVETALNAFTFCNLTTINASKITSQTDLNECAKVASFLGTLQAGYTDFFYLRPEWRENTEKDALIGCSFTGITMSPLEHLNLEEGALEVVKENARVANIIGINPASRSCLIKPEGTTSLVLGTSSGIHASHAPYYIRRMTLQGSDPLVKYMQKACPELLEKKLYEEDAYSINFPCKSPEGSVYRDEPLENFLARVKRFSQDWIAPSHREGGQRHNVSCTISVKQYEWDYLKDWMWDNRDVYNGCAVLPAFDHQYVQAPFEDCTKEVYEEMVKHVHKICIEDVVETEDNVKHDQEIACSGGKCDIV